LALGIVALGVTVWIGPGLIGMLWGIIAPPEPPVPPGVRLLDYRNEAYGVDTWTYGTDQDVCDLVAFYQDQGGTCTIVPPRCHPAPDSIIPRSDEWIASCSGEQAFTAFTMHWRFDVPLRSGLTNQVRMRFEVSRRIFWAGDAPAE
jgi:hypothetical protein